MLDIAVVAMLMNKSQTHIAHSKKAYIWYSKNCHSLFKLSSSYSECVVITMHENTDDMKSKTEWSDSSI